jgi:phosphoribosyl 1,2-cyclic phosphate phosphodiesterase
VRITFLGTGTSQGVPMIGCRCDVCLSDDPRDKRWRPSILVHLDSGPSVLVDTSADFRAQALKFDITRIDAVLFTHSHADHIFGLDETRRFNVLQREAIPLYGDAQTIADIRRIFDYAFRPVEDGNAFVPRLSPFVIDGGAFVLGRDEVVPVPIMHGARQIFGYRIGRFAYLTDCSGIPDASWPLLEGLELLVIGALRHRPHPSHFSVADAVAAARRTGAARTLFTHMCHDLGHAATCADLPPDIQLAYDGQVAEV